MTLSEVFIAIEAETSTAAWAFSPVHLKTRLIAGRLMEWGELTDGQKAIIADFLGDGSGEPLAAKVKIKRKPRTKKVPAAPLTQHAQIDAPPFR